MRDVAAGIRRVSIILFSLVVVYFFGRLGYYHYQVMTHPYPVEYREGAVLFTTELLVTHRNPYSLAEMPLGLNVYGIAYHLLVYPFAKIWGPTLIVHRAVTFGAIVIACGLLFFVLKQQDVPFVQRCSAILIIYSLSLFYITPLARPDGLGFCLLLFSAFLPSLLRYTKLSLCLSIVCGLCAFYTKPYFMIAIPYIGVYLFLFVSKKKGVYYSLSALLLLIVSGLLINHVCETYFMNTFFIYQNVVGHNLNYAVAQFLVWFYLHSGLLGMIGLALLINFKNVSNACHNVRFGYAHFNAPLINKEMPFALYALMLSMLLLYFSLGRHEGNYMIYYFQLLSPFFVVFTYSLPAMFKKQSLVLKYAHYIDLIVMLLIILSAYRSYVFLQESVLPDNFLQERPAARSDAAYDPQQWVNLERIMASCQNILNSPVIVPLLLEHQKPLYDTGQTEYFRAVRRPENPFYDLLFPPNAEFRKRWEEYIQGVQSAIIHKQFDALILTNSIFPFISQRIITQYYQYVGSIKVYLFHSHQSVRLDIWRPRID